MRRELAGKVVLVTGAGRRVGRAIALACGQAGADVAVHYRRSSVEAHALIDELRELGRDAECFAADLSVASDCRALVEAVLGRFGHVDVLVNNAASFVSAPFVASDSDDEDRWERAFETSLATNLVAPARLIRMLEPTLRRRRGVVVNLHDVAAVKAWPGHLHHGAAKAGLAFLTRSLAATLAPDIRVCGVQPGIALFPVGATADEKAHQVEQTLLKRPGTAEGVADAVVFVATHRDMTGAHIAVDGGWGVPR